MSRKRAHAKVNLVKNSSQPAQYILEDDYPLKSDEFMASSSKFNDTKNTTAEGKNVIVLSSLINHKFLVSGHSCLPCNHDFSLVEKHKMKMKNMNKNNCIIQYIVNIISKMLFI